MKTITTIAEEIKEAFLAKGELPPRLYIAYTGNNEELIQFSLATFPHLHEANDYFFQLGRQRRRSHPDDRLHRLCYVSKAKLITPVFLECIVIIALTIDTMTPAFEQSLLVSRIVRRSSGQVRALISMGDLDCAFLNHHLLYFLRGFLGKKRFQECREALETLLITQSERQVP